MLKRPTIANPTNEDHNSFQACLQKVLAAPRTNNFGSTVNLQRGHAAPLCKSQCPRGPGEASLAADEIRIASLRRGPQNGVFVWSALQWSAKMILSAFCV